MGESIRADEIDLLTASAAQTPAAAGMTTRVARGTLWTLVGHGAVMVASLVATPFTIRMLGPESYGVLALVNVLIGYLAFTDVGMGLTATRFATEAHARRDDAAEAAVVWTSTAIALVPACLAALALALLAPTLVDDFLRLPSHLHDSSVLVLRLAAVAFIARTVAGVVNAPQLARLQMALNTLVTSGMLVAQSCLVPVVIFLGAGLVGAAAAITAVSISAAIAHLVLSRRLLPRLSIPRFDLALMKPLLLFGRGLVASSIAGLVLVNAEKLLLPRFASVSALAYYAVAFSVAGVVGLVPAAMMRSLLPAFSRLHSESDRQPLARLYSRALRANVLWLAPAALVMCVGARPFFEVWAGPEFAEKSTIPFYVLVGGLIFNVMAYVPYTLLMAFNRSDLIGRVHLAEVVPYILCAALFTSWLGASGAAIAWSLRVAVDAVVFFIASRRITGFRLSAFQNNRLACAIAVGALAIPLVMLFTAAASRTALMASAVFSLIIYAALIWKTVLSVDERVWFGRLMSWRPTRDAA